MPKVASKSLPSGTPLRERRRADDEPYAAPPAVATQAVRVRTEPETAATWFKNKGFAIITLYSPDEAAALSKRLCDAVKTAPEFETGSPPEIDGSSVAPSDRHTLGSFGAVNLPSVIHSDVAREMRQDMHVRMKELVAGLMRGLCDSRSAEHAKFAVNDEGHPTIAGNRVYFKQLFDRPLVRDAAACNATGSKNGWHRDMCGAGQEATYGRDGELGFRIGGWLALQHTQDFVYAPGTAAFKVLPGGFAKSTKADCKRYAASEIPVKVKPGQVVIYDETLARRVAPTRNSTGRPMVRMFLAFDVNADPGYGPQPLYPLEEARDGKVVTLKSGQVPRMYPKIYWINHLENLLAYAGKLEDTLLVNRTRNTTKETFSVPRLQCPSMVEQGLDPPGYTDEELSAFKGALVP